jgi:nucleoside 2-deoxyribosyltransferase
MNRRVYLAGPDVFYPDAAERATKLKALCRARGLEGVFPLDSGIRLLQPLEQAENGYRIYRANIKLIESCFAILANISPFRGPSVDAGTAFEIGFGAASGLDVVAYTTDKSDYKTRVEPDGLLIEDFSMVDNLMIHAATGGNIYTTPEEGINYLVVLCSSGEPTRPIRKGELGPKPV